MRILSAMMLLGSVCLLADGLPPNKVSVTEYDNVLPQVADGNGWLSRITLVNMDLVPATVDVLFYHEDGTPWSIGLKGQTGTNSDWQFTIPVGGSKFLETLGTDSTTTQGWAYVSTAQWVSGNGAFVADWRPTNDAEAVVPFSNEYDSRFFIPFDNRPGFVTSLALVNPSTSTTASIVAQLRDPDGNVMYTDTITLAPLQHLAFSTIDRYGNTVQGKNGAIQFTVGPTGTGRASALGLLFNNNRHSFTSVHSVSVDPLYCLYVNSAYCAYL
jgi:hypothetical protein